MTEVEEAAYYAMIAGINTVLQTLPVIECDLKKAGKPALEICRGHLRTLLDIIKDVEKIREFEEKWSETYENGAGI